MQQFTLFSKIFATALTDFWKDSYLGYPGRVSQICCLFVCFLSLKEICSHGSLQCNTLQDTQFTKHR